MALKCTLNVLSHRDVLLTVAFSAYHKLNQFSNLRIQHLCFTDQSYVIFIIYWRGLPTRGLETNTQLTYQHFERHEDEACSIFSTQVSLQEWDMSTNKTSCIRINRNPPASPKYIQTRLNERDWGISIEHVTIAETEKLKAS